jgi:hypothetical protein
VTLQPGNAQYSVLPSFLRTQLSTWQALASTIRASSVFSGLAAWAGADKPKPSAAHAVSDKQTLKNKFKLTLGGNIENLFILMAFDVSLATCR